MKNKILYTLVVCSLLFMLSGCFSSTNKVTNNTINNRVVKVEDYTIADFQDVMEVAAEKAEQSVVAIIDSGMLSSSLGSAVVVKRIPMANNKEVTNDGKIEYYKYYAITNNHVIDGKLVNNLNVYMRDSITNEGYKSTRTKVEDHDRKLDLALISFETTLYLEEAVVGNSNKLKKGQLVLAVGTPMKLELFNTVTQGVISHPYRYTTSDNGSGYYIQHDAAINPGNSGGGLFTIEGKLIGINTWKYVDDDNSAICLGFAIPTSVIIAKYKNFITNIENN